MLFRRLHPPQVARVESTLPPADAALDAALARVDRRLRQRWHDTAAWERLLWVRVHDLGAAARALRLGTRAGTDAANNQLAIKSKRQLKHNSSIESIRHTSTVFQGEF